MIRIIANVGFRDHTKTLFFKLKLLTVYDRINIKLDPLYLDA